MKNIRTTGVLSKVLPRHFRIKSQGLNYMRYLAGSANWICALHSVVTGIGKETAVKYLRPLSQRPSGGTPFDFTIQLLFVTRSCYVCWGTADDTNEHANMHTDGGLSDVQLKGVIGTCR